jgi:prepilin-type N-terminal cleavage/methylation domain-containing protein
MNSIKNKNKKGFTLLETLVALTIFAFVVTICVGSVVQILAVNRQAQSTKISINNLNMALENMTIDLRFGSNYWCQRVDIHDQNLSGEPGEDRLKYNLADTEGLDNGGAGLGEPYYSCKSITFLFREDGGSEFSRKPTNYSLVGGQIIRSMYINGEWKSEPITAGPDDGLDITKLDLHVLGAYPPSYYESNGTSERPQPLVLIIIEGKAGKGKNQTPFKLQTAVSQRAHKDY